MCAAFKAHNVPRQHGSIELGIKHATATSPKPSAWLQLMVLKAALVRAR